MSSEEEFESEIALFFESLADEHGIKWLDVNVTWHHEAGVQVNVKEIEQ